MNYYYDATTDTVRRYPFDKETGERWDKKTHEWSKECCARSGCRWDEAITEEQAQRIVEQQ